LEWHEIKEPCLKKRNWFPDSFWCCVANVIILHEAEFENELMHDFEFWERPVV
jgi:hypothetical protein